MEHDHVDAIVAAWTRERPDLDPTPMGVIGRITRASRVLDRELERVFAEHGLDGPGFDVLATLRRSGRPYLLSASALADATMVARSSTTSRIERLVADGFVERVPNEHDGRGVDVRLTPAGLEVIDRAVAAHVENETRLLSSLSTGARKRLADDLRRLLMALDG
jgi:DNA-binding MarR family transcriptional regulator